MTNEKIVISKSDIIINGKLEYKTKQYYIVVRRKITGEITVLSENKCCHRFSAKEACKYFITKLDKCFMYNGIEYFNDHDKEYYKKEYNSNERTEIEFDEYIKALINWEFYKIN